jgi:quercetin dioxygenase-like cupin family protein
VIEGEATVNRAAASAGQAVETYGAGETVELRAGDALVEPTGMVHRAINETQEIVIIYLSSLFPEGAPPATTVE